MKKTIILSAVAIMSAMAVVSCNRTKEETQVAETQTVVGDVVEMPSDPGDTTVIAAGEAIAVQENAPSAN